MTEPVAWTTDGKEVMRLDSDDDTLHTHPVQKPMMVLDGNRVYPAFKELTYADGIEECAQRAEAYAYMSHNFTALAEELRAILRKAQEK